MTPRFLVAMRLTDMAWVHPKMDSSRACSECGETLGIYPSGQALLRAYPALKIVCQECMPEADVFVRAPGSFAEAGESVRRSDKKSDP
jgi:hypothetical protein